ncbi:MAG TPA: TIGR02996 domain-containing protein [Kofleriaceae bacterium]|nr:TIGR02996 domain-containing protein [Kofleriaceae bacterium]
MGGILWSTWRSVRGIEVTYRLMLYRRWAHRGIAQWWHDHITRGIAEDGAPTGFEYVFRFESFLPDLVIFGSTWHSFAGARRLRELFLSATDLQPLIDAHERLFERDPHPVRASAVDLDAIHALAAGVDSLEELAARLRMATWLHPVPVPRCFPGTVIERGGPQLSSELEARRARCDATERALLEQIEADPRQHGPLLVYADWLEVSGRADDAADVRARSNMTTYDGR